MRQPESVKEPLQMTLKNVGMYTTEQVLITKVSNHLPSGHFVHQTYNISCSRAARMKRECAAAKSHLRASIHFDGAYHTAKDASVNLVQHWLGQRWQNRSLCITVAKYYISQLICRAPPLARLG
uniref:Predicted protein n=1 Tax=Physcomitrium patens TaxID=3218 RepID=A9TXZ3_PHYPA